MATLPTTIGGKYSVVRRLGKGGMGTVFEAVAEDTGQRVAVKVIAGDIAEDSTLVTRFQREARATTNLDTPHIAKVFDAGVDPITQVPFMAMEYLDGEDLRQVLKRTGALAPDVAVRIATQACRALQAAHAAGILHRDIKPANLFLARDGSGGRIVKLLDFGVAKVTHPELTGDAEVTGLTRTGSMIGSPLYMSPEQARGYRNIDGRSDLWSLGVVLYQMLAGRTPHAKIDELGELLVRICTEPPPPLQRRAPWVAAPIVEVVHLALGMDPADRFPDAATFLRALEGLAPGDEPIAEASLRALTDAERGNAPAETSHPSLEDGVTRRAPPGSGGASSTSNIAIRPAVALAPLTDSRAGAPIHAQPGPVSTLTNGSSSVASEGLRPPPERKARAYAVVFLGAVAVAVVTYVGMSRGPAPAGPGSAAQPHPTAVEARPRTVKVVVLARDATVQIDGIAAEVTDGLVEVTGTLGSVHKLRITAGEETRVVDVAITENGPVPAKVELDAARPAAPATAAATATATASVAPPSEPRPAGASLPSKPRPAQTAAVATPTATATHTGRTLRDDR